MAYFKMKGRLPGGRLAIMFIKSDGQFKQTRIGETLTGIRVNRDGDEGDALNIVMAAREDVISLKPYEMDLLYCTLVPLGRAKIGIKDL